VTTDVAELPVVLTVEEAASVLRIGRGPAYEGIRRGQIPAVRIGRTLRVPRAALLTLLGENGSVVDGDSTDTHSGEGP
jgi:excisionase family DNA binding protein